MLSPVWRDEPKLSEPVVESPKPPCWRPEAPLLP